MFRVIIALITLIMPLRLSAQNGPIEELDLLLRDISTLSADVLQLIVESDGGILEETKIQMRLKKPNRFYWETIDPFPELIVTNGATLWNYQPDLEQVTIEDWNSDDSELAAQLLNGETDNLSDEYYIVVINSEETKSFELSPKINDNIYNTVSITFINDILDMIHLDGKSGEQTVWQFNNLVMNSPIADSLFEFIIPNDIDIIGNTTN